MMTANDPITPAKAAPVLQIPPGRSVKVQIIDTTSRLESPIAPFMHPPMKGHDQLAVPAFGFFIEQQASSRKLVFDLGLRKDWEKHPPYIQDIIGGPGWRFDIKKGIAEILQENGVDVLNGAIEAAIWSHWHFDHIGDMRTFPHSTNLITGAGVSEAFIPAYPTNPASPLLESDFEGRKHIEIDFKAPNTIQIGGFKAMDYFEDGSFYLLDCPGHAIGHICGLARVTSSREGDEEDTFIFMGGDTAHHGGEFRPTEYLPLPNEIRPSPYSRRYPTSCPAHVFAAIHLHNKANAPFYHLADGIAHDKEQAETSCASMEVFDAADNVFVIIAHDDTILDPTVGVEWFPQGTLRDWKKKDCASKARWGFLKDFVQAIEG